MMIPFFNSCCLFFSFHKERQESEFLVGLALLTYHDEVIILIML